MSFGDLITTTEAAQLTGRSVDAVRAAMNKKYLRMVRRNDLGRPLLSREEVLAWSDSAGLYIKPRSTAYTSPVERAAELLATYHSLTTHELADLSDVHIGNARKHLALLAKHGRAYRRSDGQWVLTVASSTAPGAA